MNELISPWTLLLGGVFILIVLIIIAVALYYFLRM